MEREINRDSFERLLREKSDDFRMYPSNKVWNSIYNNFHPGRKWPSVAMCIGLITTLLMVGYLNTNSTHSKTATPVTNPAVAETTAPVIPPAATAAYNTVIATNNLSKKALQSHATPAARQYATHSNVSKRSTAINIKASSNVTTINTIEVDETDTNNTTPENTFTAAQLTGNNTGSGETTETQSSFVQSIQLPETVTEFSRTEANTAALTTKLNEKIYAENKAILAATEKQSNTAALNPEQISWIEDYALHNRPVTKAWKGKLAWQAYAAPSIVYRRLYNNINKEHAQQFGFTNSIYYDNIEQLITEKPSWGMEAGAGLQYSLLKWVKLRTGIQMNYTRYVIHAFKNSHPTTTALTMIHPQTQLPYEVFRSTPYSNKFGLIPARLRNQTLQLSIPVGLDLRLSKMNNLEWYVAGSIQPTLVLGGSAYLISSDRLSYVSDKSMLSSLNMNMAFETYLSYKSSNGYTWQLGPQYRTQLSSTYTGQYAIGEKLQNYSFKVGISKAF
ncbi:MAG TPA: hypothetical protein PKC39_00430 [Ferruginibacter sp.]|nr:hypothetical protein [Ferruginibacter sp.]HMP19396.1 hypothetical protein [Ferruginibacter sp.]